MAKPRSIFEEVGSKPAEPVVVRPQRPQGDRSAIRAWLAVLFALVVRRHRASAARTGA